jgi:hypothetical protein
LVRFGRLFADCANGPSGRVARSSPSRPRPVCRPPRLSDDHQ